MLYLRSVLFFIGQVLWTCLLFFFIIFTIVLPVETRLYIIANIWTRPMIWWLRIICGIDYKVEGKENIPKENGYIILSKHQSAWETLVFQLIFPRNIWVLKKELLFIPFFGWALFLGNPIAIKRSQGKEAMKQLKSQGKQRLDAGLNVVIFPEGTRSSVGEHKRFKHGGSLLAKETAADIIPVALNAGKYWPKNSFLKYPGTVMVRIGKAIQADENKTVEQITQQVEQWVTSNSDELAYERDKLSATADKDFV